MNDVEGDQTGHGGAGIRDPEPDRKAADKQQNGKVNEQLQDGALTRGGGMSDKGSADGRGAAGLGRITLLGMLEPCF